jgi:hypothetical protein
VSYAPVVRAFGQEVEPTLAALDAVSTMQLGVRWYTKDVAALIRQRLKGVMAEAWPGAPGRYAVLFRGKPHYYGSETTDAANLLYLAEGKGQFVWADANCPWPTGNDGIIEIRPFPMPEALVSTLGAHLPLPDVVTSWTEGSALGPGAGASAKPSTGYEVPSGPEPPPAAAEPSEVEAPKASWWSAQPDSTKVLVIGLSAAGALSLLAVLLGRLRDKLTPNYLRGQRYALERVYPDGSRRRVGSARTLRQAQRDAAFLARASLTPVEILDQRDMRAVETLRRRTGRRSGFPYVSHQRHRALGGA